MTKEIYMRHKQLGTVIALVDDEDYAIISRHTWFVRSTSQNKLYPTTTLPTRSDKPKLVAMHYFIMGAGEIDHRNGNPLDNRKDNLRKATRQQNGWNKGKTPQSRHGVPTSQFKGVSRYKRADGSVYFRVLIRTTPNGIKPQKFIRMGPYDSEIEAAKAYNAKVIELRGEFAWVNPIPSEAA